MVRQIKNRIEKYSTKIFFPDALKHGISVSDECQDFIKKCLNINPSERLGSSQDAIEVLTHPWL
jgi:serine/threonine protein kinase